MDSALRCAWRNGKWQASAIHGEPAKGTGILNKERYIGRHAWGRTTWVRVEAAEAELAKLADAGQVVDITALLAALPSWVDRYRLMVADLGKIARDNIPRAQAILRGVLGEVRVRREGDALIAEMGLNETPLTAFAGGAHIGVVAGARFPLFRLREELK